MKRFVIFAALFPRIALVVFTAPDGFNNLLDWMVMASAAIGMNPIRLDGSRKPPNRTHRPAGTNLVR